MDSSTGIIHSLEQNETMPQLARRIGAKEQDMIPVFYLPKSDCTRCNGTGRRSAGMFSKRFKPCRCTHKQ